MRKSAIVQLINVFALLAGAEAALFRNSLEARVALPQEGPGPGKGQGRRPPGPGKGNQNPPPPPGPPQQQPSPTTTSTTISTTSTTVEPPTSTSPTSTAPPPPPPPSETTTSASTPSPTLLPTRPIFTAQPILDTTNTPILVTSVPIPSLPSSPQAPLISTPAVLPPPPASQEPVPSSTELSINPSASRESPIVIEPTSPATPSSPPKPPGIPTPIMADTGSKQTLVIVLSVVLGSIVLILCTLAFFLFGRCRQRRMKKRGVTPINDEEIDSWRSTEKKTPLTVNTRSVELSRTGTLIPLSPDSERGAGLTPVSPDWGWSFSAAQSIQSPPPTRSRGPSIVATMPNARLGLTTDTVPGAEPYVPTHNRQSSRFSKDRKHDRSKSMRSSASARSMRSMNGDGVTGFDFTLNNEAYMPWLTYTTNKDIADISTIGGSTPHTSVYVPSTESGGLSPRTKAPQLEPLVLPTALSPRPEQRQFQSTQAPLVSPSQWPKSWR